MELHLRIETIPVLRCQILGVQDRIGLPSLSIPIVSVLLEPACLGAEFLGDRVFAGFTVERVSVLFRTHVGGLGGAYPLFGLNRGGSTTQAG